MPGAAALTSRAERGGRGGESRGIGALRCSFLLVPGRGAGGRAEPGGRRGGGGGGSSLRRAGQRRGATGKRRRGGRYHAEAAGRGIRAHDPGAARRGRFLPGMDPLDPRERDGRSLAAWRLRADRGRGDPMERRSVRWRPLPPTAMEAPTGWESRVGSSAECVPARVGEKGQPRPSASRP